MFFFNRYLPQNHLDILDLLLCEKPKRSKISICVQAAMAMHMSRLLPQIQP